MHVCCVSVWWIDGVKDKRNNYIDLKKAAEDRSVWRTARRDCICTLILFIQTLALYKSFTYLLTVINLLNDWADSWKEWCTSRQASRSLRLAQILLPWQQGSAPQHFARFRLIGLANLVVPFMLLQHVWRTRSLLSYDVTMVPCNVIDVKKSGLWSTR